MVGIFGVDIKFEDWVKRAEDIAEATQIALRGEYEAKSDRIAGCNLRSRSLPLFSPSINH